MKKLIIGLVLLLFTAGCGGPAAEDPRLTAIAQCLTANGVKMYGSVWCSHCSAQKKAFGESFKYIDYIECDANTNLEQAKQCLKDDIEALPTWTFPDGTRVIGETTPEDLAEKFSC